MKPLQRYSCRWNGFFVIEVGGLFWYHHDIDNKIGGADQSHIIVDRQSSCFKRQGLEN
jgi:hypothetical protein